MRCGTSSSLWSRINLDAVAVGFLRLIERRVRRREKSGQRQDAVAGGALCDTNAQRWLMLQMCDRIGEIDRRKRLPKLLHDLLRLVNARLRQRNHELIAPIAKRQVGL